MAAAAGLRVARRRNRFESGYSGGVDYIYLTYDNVPVDYDGGALTTTAPGRGGGLLVGPGNFASLFS